MFKNFIKKYKLIIVFLLIVLILLPFTIYKPAETEKIAVATSLGIDVDSNNLIELTLNILVPSDGNSDNGGSLGLVKTINAKSNSINSALAKISLELGKIVGLAHCDAVVVSLDVLKEDVIAKLDYFIRTNNLTSNSALIVTNKSAKQIIEASAKEKTELALSLSHIINFNKEYLFTTDNSIEKFYKNYFSPSGISILPMLSIENQNVENSKLSSQKSNGGSKPVNILKNEGNAVVLKRGKIVRQLSKEEVFALNLINGKTKKGHISAKNVNSKVFRNANLSLEVFDKYVLKTGYFANDVPVFNIDLKLILKLKEVQMSDYSLHSIDSTKTFLDNNVKKSIELSIQKMLSKTINEAKESKTDVFNIYEYFYKFHNKKWLKYINSLKDKDDFLNGVIFTISVFQQGKI